VAENVFSSLSKYASASDENYLTEALVFLVKLLLERKPAAGLDTVNFLCGQSRGVCFGDPKSVAIATQVAVDLGRPDIEIRDGTNTLVYIEVKHDSPLGVNQLERYKAQLQESGLSNTLLVLLTRSRSSLLETSLQPDEYHHICWYDIYNWLSNVDTKDAICQYFIRSFMSFLEDKSMSLKKVTWEYIQGVPSLINLTTMMEAAVQEVMPAVALRRTAGWSWRGFYLDNAYFLGIRYERPLTVTFENNFGNNPTATHELDLEGRHFFSLSREEQFEGLINFLQTASQEVPKGSVSAEPIE
jgi:hypothetical protein